MLHNFIKQNILEKFSAMINEYIYFLIIQSVYAMNIFDNGELWCDKNEWCYKVLHIIILNVL